MHATRETDMHSPQSVIMEAQHWTAELSTGQMEVNMGILNEENSLVSCIITKLSSHLPGNYMWEITTKIKKIKKKGQLHFAGQHCHLVVIEQKINVSAYIKKPTTNSKERVQVFIKTSNGCETYSYL